MFSSLPRFSKPFSFSHLYSKFLSPTHTKNKRLNIELFYLFCITKYLHLNTLTNEKPIHNHPPPPIYCEFKGKSSLLVLKCRCRFLGLTSNYLNLQKFQKEKTTNIKQMQIFFFRLLYAALKQPVKIQFSFIFFFHFCRQLWLESSNVISFIWT